MAARAALKTTLEFGAVYVPVALHKLESSNGDVSFSKASPDGNPAGYRWFDKVTGELLETADLRVGVFEDAKAGTGFREIGKENVDEINAAGKLESIEILGFMTLAEVPFERARGAYYVAAQSGGATPPKPLALLREALRASGKAGVFKVSIRDRQHPAVIYEKNGALLVNTLAWAEDTAEGMAAASTSTAEAALDPKHQEMALQLIDALSVDREDLDALTDDVRPMRAQLVEDALAGKKVVAPKGESHKATEESGDALLEALTASVAEGATAKKKGKPASKKAAKTAA